MTDLVRRSLGSKHAWFIGWESLHDHMGRCSKQFPPELLPFALPARDRGTCQRIRFRPVPLCGPPHHRPLDLQLYVSWRTYVEVVCEIWWVIEEREARIRLKSSVQLFKR